MPLTNSPALQDYFGEVSLGNVPGHSAVNKFGYAPAGAQTTATDVWDRANATPTQPVWLAPTAANKHTIKSSSAADVSGSTGTTSVTVWYLPDWDTAEASETVTGDINTGVEMNNTAVIINRMKANAQSTTTSPGVNAGTITATAAAPSATTISAVILPENGQTEMAIYGVPSTQKALLYSWHGKLDKASGAAGSVDFVLRLNENPNVQTVAFVRKDDLSVQSTGDNSDSNEHRPPPQFPGPCIIKVQALASANDLDVKAGFDLVLVEN